MEITTGTEAAPEGAAGAEGAAAAEGAEQGPDIGSLLSEFGTRLDSFGERLGEIAQPAAAGGEETGGAAGAEPEISMPQYTVADFDEDGALSLDAQAREMNRIAEEIADRKIEGVQAERAAEREEIAWQGRDADADALEAKYPDLADPVKQDQYLQIAAELADDLGRPDLAAEPKWLERVYLSEVAKQKAGDEIPAGDEQGVRVERGGAAAAAAAAGGEMDDGDRIVAAARSRRHRVT